VAGTGKAHLRDDALLRVEDLVVEFPAPGGGTVHAVSGISLDVREGETVALLGESGSGKSTTARAILHHVPANAGTIRLGSDDLTTLDSEHLRQTRIKMQMVFQDPKASLNPNRRVAEIIGEGLRIWKMGSRTERRQRVREVMEAVGLPFDTVARRRPAEFSGGQCQRISIARALVMEPKVMVCDEPVSALDVSIQAQILNVLADMRDRYSLTMLFITHDMSVMKHISDRAIVMYLGKICEVAPPDVLHTRPAHPYTAALIEAIPVPDPASRLPSERPTDLVEPPSPLAPPSGCRFRTRCPRAQPMCAETEPTLRSVGANHYIACHFPIEHTDTGAPHDVAVGVL
jgi:peptide/nickel transport system ATP-binding protein